MREPDRGNVRYESDHVALTASIVIAAAPEDAYERSVLVAHANANLYRAKKSGRDQIMS